MEKGFLGLNTMWINQTSSGPELGWALLFGRVSLGHSLLPIFFTSGSLGWWNVSFWHDTWIGDYSLKTRFWDLFIICQQQDASVAQVWDGGELVVAF